MKAALKVDLMHIEGLGDFPCPRCGTVISPDDVSEETYKVLETKEKNVLILCNKCNSIIDLVGLEGLNESEELPFKPRRLKGNTEDQILQLLEEGVPLTMDEIAEELNKTSKAVFRSLRRLFDQGKIDQDQKDRSYSLVA